MVDFQRHAENSLKSRSEFWVQKLPQRSAEYFGLFSLEKVSTVSKRNIRRWYPQMFAQGTWYHRANISTKMLVKHSHFRDVLSVSAWFNALESCGSNSAATAFIKPRACLCERVFCVPLKIYHGLSFFFLVHFSSFFLERRKKNEH